MKSNTTILIIVTLIIAGGAYWYFFTGTGDAPSLSEIPAANSAQVRFQTLVSELQPISFNTDIFSDVRFNALVDLTTPVTPEDSGRSDPFAPLLMK